MIKVCSLLLLFLVVSSNGQDSTNPSEPLEIFRTGKISFPFEDECGSPVAESQIFDFRSGEVTQVLNGNKITFRQRVVNGNKEEKTFLVRLAGIDPNEFDQVRAFLIKNILSKKVDVIGNTKEDHDMHLDGILRGGGFGDINAHLIENGMAKFLEPNYFYSVSHYKLCTYQQLQKRAKANRLGVWRTR